MLTVHEFGKENPKHDRPVPSAGRLVGYLRIRDVKKIFPGTEFIENPNQDHAEFFTLHPEAFAAQLSAFTENANKGASFKC